MNKDISILIPTYNEEKYLRKTLESIFSQKTKYSYEVIIGDSNSTDETRDIAKEFGCRIADAPLGSAAYGRHAAALVSKGKVLVSTDADTIHRKDWLENLGKAILEENHKGAVGKVLPMDGNIVERIFSEVILHPIAHITHALNLPFATGANMAVERKAYFQVGGFNTKLKTCEDIDLIKRISKIGKIKYVPTAAAYMSMRRVREWGYGKYILFHTGNFINWHLKKKAHEGYEFIR